MAEKQVAEVAAAAPPSPRAGEDPSEPGRSGFRGWLVAVLVIAVALVAASRLHPHDDTSATAGDEPAASESAAPAEDTSLQDAIDAAGVSGALVAQLGQVAGDTGYGLTRGVPLTGDDAKSFAVVQIGTCRDLASGFRTSAEIIASDVADGAADADARTMSAFLTGTFCPAVQPASQAAPTARPTAGPAARPPADGTRGLLSSVDQLDAAFAPGSLAECAAATGQPLGEPHAYALPGGQLLCGDFITGGAWDPYFINLDLVFPQPVPFDQALAVIASVLPADIGPADSRQGENPPYAPSPGGCLSVVWRSPTAAATIARISPDWDGGPEVSAVLYSDRQTSDGSSAPFDGTVKVAGIGIGGHNDSQGVVIC